MDVAPSQQQRKAVEAPLGPVLVVAGPGAGKTFCLIGRIEYLTTRLAPAPLSPTRICAVTFTNKAADEIAARLARTLGGGPHAEDVHRGTIHSLCLEILREHAEAAGLKAGFGVADDDYQRTILRRLGHARRAGQLLQSFGRLRFSARKLTGGDERIFRDYEAQLRRRNVVDFDELIVRTHDLFTRRPDVATRVAARWDYVLVDEFQDVNPAQYAILRALAPHGNIFAVGDDEQSIFGWTGAVPDVLQRFQRDHGIAAAIPLDRNYRSAQQIFAVARRLLAANPLLFEKVLVAPRQSVHEVQALAFEDDDAETDWLVQDLRADRASEDARALAWGDYAVLYRRHEIGERLEARLLKEGVPCRLAKGRPITEDPVIGYVIAALRLVRDPHDPVAAEQLARRVLPQHLMERLQAEVGGATDQFLLAVRDLAGSLRGDPDAKKLWRFVYQVENLAGLGRAHATLGGLVQELLSQHIGPYRNKLEERGDELTDPREVPAAARLAERLMQAQRAKSRIVVEPMNGLEVAVRGLLFEAGFRLVRYAGEVDQAELDDVTIGPEPAAGGPEGLAYTLFKALQLVHARDVAGAYHRYVTFDLETTDLDTTACEIVEIAAVRAEGGRVVESFRELVKPDRPVSAAARRVHGHDDAALAAAPCFAEVWPRFRAFVGADVLIGHNAQQFDVPVRKGMAAPRAGGEGEGGAEGLVVYDTLPLARDLSGDSAKLEDLAARFGVATGRAHHALDDATTLVGVYEALEQKRVTRARKSALVNGLAYLGLALVLDDARRDTDEVKLLLDTARIHTLGRFSDALDHYAAEHERLALRGPALEEVVQRLGGARLMARLREETDASRRYPSAVARLRTLIEQDEGEPLHAAIERFLERVLLSTSQGAETSRDAINLLTLHSTKGLEFSRVYVVGVEDEQLPGWVAAEDDETLAFQEARRLLYVGMTRARDRVVLTRVDRRAGKPAGPSRFLEEMQLRIERPGKLPQPA